MAITDRELRRVFPAAPVGLWPLLDPSRGPLSPPLRAQVLGELGFARHARELAASHLAVHRRRGPDAFEPRLQHNLACLRQCRQWLGAQSAAGAELGPAADWLLDHFHLLEATWPPARDDLTRRLYRSLPVLAAAPLSGLPRIVALGWSFVAHSDGDVQPAALSAFLRAYQSAGALELAELWALPSTLRLLLLESLRRLAERVATDQAAHVLADLCADRPRRPEVALMARLHRRLEARGCAQAFLLQLVVRLADEEPRQDDAPRAAVRAWLRELLPDPPAARAARAAGAAADNLSVSNAIRTLRRVGDVDWPALVSGVSPVIRRLEAWPTFAQEDMPSRDLTLHALERVARRAGRPQEQVAQALLDCLGAAAAAGEAVPRTLHWLDGPGLPALHAALGGPPPRWAMASWRARAAARRALPAAYLLVLASGTLALVGALLGARAAAPPGPWWMVLPLLALPASEVVVALLHRLLAESLPPARLPRLAWEEGIPAAHRVLVVVPAMLTDPLTTRALLDRLVLHHLANPEPEAQFALLTDFADADRAQLPTDQALLDDALAALAAIEAEHGAAAYAGAPPRFLLLHRPRRHCPGEGRWMGWERKRGKLEQLVAQAAVGDTGAFLPLGRSSRLRPGIRHVLTLDADTELPPGRLRALVAIAAHPAQRPRLDPRGTRVVAGHAILQPRLSVPLPAAGTLTPFQWLFAGRPGIDPYSAASSEVYQDLFGEGSFCGKGLLDVQAVHRVLGGRLPEGRVLSHDLVEGALARCAAVSDVTLVEDAPTHPDAAAARLHRWMRGDWQLLPVLLAPSRWPLGAINRWKLADNLRRSLVAPACAALLPLSIAGIGASPGATGGVVLAAFMAGPGLGALAGVLPARRGRLNAWFLRAAAVDLGRTLALGGWHLLTLPSQTLLALDAVTRTLWRLLVSHRHLLQWTPAAVAQARLRPGLGPVLRRHAAVPAVAVAVGAALLAADAPAAAAGGLGLAWGLSPWLIGWASRPRPGPPRLPEATRAYLDGIAREAWRWFERTVTAQDHHLPPDNRQTLPQEAVAHRTSPTNIGLYLLSAACARHRGWIGADEFLERLRHTLDTLDRLPRHRGHFLNWYDTARAEALAPAYVSTVDSGNLSGCLLAVAAACRELDAPVGDPGSARHLAQRCEDLAWAPRWDFLFDRRRRLMHVGWRVGEQQPDPAHYDLLASEARLASLLAIASGQVPVAHWSALGRPVHTRDGQVVLRSWSGSMFEYLMPSLLLDEPPDSLLALAGAAAVRAQRARGAQLGLPWGISECAHAGRDETLAYQYGPQGVPDLALSRPPVDECVVAPYATALAALTDPQAAGANFLALEALGARGPDGFVEALDFTPRRQTAGTTFTLVATQMAHHQGMTVVALAGVLAGGASRRWGMASPRLRAVASLLHERPPRELTALPLPPAAGREADAAAVPAYRRRLRPGRSAVPPTHLLSNGRLSQALRPDGSGELQLGAAGIDRRRDDLPRAGLAAPLWWRRPGGPAHPLAPRPAPASGADADPEVDPAEAGSAVYLADRAVFESWQGGFHARVTVWVSPEDDIVFRQVELHNPGEQGLALELLSVFEPTLATPQADEAHPAFGGLFVRAWWRAASQALVLSRTPRSAGERDLWAAHFLAAAQPAVLAVSALADRARWAGRVRDAGQPLAAFAPMPPGDDPVGVPLPTGLDPVAALGVHLHLPAQGRLRLTLAVAASHDGGVLSAVIDKHRQAAHVQRAALMSATLAGIRLRAGGPEPATWAAIQSLTTALRFTLPRPGAVPADDGASPAFDRRALWRLGLSGERALLLVHLGDVPGAGLLRALAQSARTWAWAGVPCDLVLVDTEAPSYLMPGWQALQQLRERHEADAAVWEGAAGVVIHVLRADRLTAAEQRALVRVARVRLRGDGRPLAALVQAWLDGHEAEARARRTGAACVPLAPAPEEELPVPPAWRFSAADGACRFEVGPRERPARPWMNVLANPGFGIHLTEAGGGHAWSGNSRLHQLTPWSNDPLRDPVGMGWWLHDVLADRAWQLTPSAFAAPGATYRVTHAPGFSRMRHRHDDLLVRVDWCVDPELAVLQVRVRLRLGGTRARLLRVVGLVEWVLGASRAERAHLRTSAWRRRGQDGCLTVLGATREDAAGGHGGATAFLALGGSDEDADDWTTDRLECIDAAGGPCLPLKPGRRRGEGLDPCAFVGSTVRLLPGQGVERVFLLGHAGGPEAARDLADRAARVPAAQRLAAVRAHWRARAAPVQVHSPDPLFDLMVNHWLPLQTVACRLWARAGFYQAGGATGFRDQLQDAMSLAWSDPPALRAQILRHAARQFEAGDVQHWWHDPEGAGVRTRISDDRLWLPLACLRHLDAGGARSLLDERVPFLGGAPLGEGESDRYEQPPALDAPASVFEHAARAIDRSLESGPHGLPLMGGGDWNDGMNLVGAGGRGESVWLAWLLLSLLPDFIALARSRGEGGRAARWREAELAWRDAVDRHAWDGGWYRRAWFDDGTPLGTAQGQEARIDLIAQAWAVLSGAAPPERAREALQAAQALLADPAAGLMRLLDPPLQHARPVAGYIQAYPPGVRENGGHYSHAVVWACMAWATLARQAGARPDDAAAAWRLWRWVSPAHRSRDPVQGPAGGLEPWAVAGDLRTEGLEAGRGGWSWYTGAAGWLHRAAVESLLGLRLLGEDVAFEPCLPPEWPGARLVLRRDGRELQVTLCRDGVPAPPGRVLGVGERLCWRALPEDAPVAVTVRLPRTPGP